MHFFNRHLFTPGDRVLVALSGGADSLALLHALSAARAELAIEIAAAHVHHGMRGAEADADVRFLEQLCAGLRVPLWVQRHNVAALARSQGIGVEEAGRRARYAALGLFARQHDCGKVATAHHADDQVETVLLNLFRGAGIDGLAGIPERRPLDTHPGAPELVRPLLTRRRAETEAYCRKHGLTPRDDRTNRDLRYRRNRLRLELLPLLEGYEPRLPENLLRLSKQAREEKELLDEAARALLESWKVGTVERWKVGNIPTLQPSNAAAVPPALARRALRLLLREAARDEVEVDSRLLDRLVALARGEGPAAVDLPGCALRARRRGELLVLEDAGARIGEVPVPVVLIVPGRTDAPAFGLRVTAEGAPPPEDPRLPPDECIVDADAVPGPFVLRAPLPGERFRPLGAPGSRLLSDFFMDHKVPRDRRRQWPVVADGAGIVWVVGLAVAERGRVDSGTRRCWRLRAED